MKGWLNSWWLNILAACLAGFLIGLIVADGLMKV